ncbi:MAG: TIGR00296 family protein [Candidatus Micrarchaeia archaeon]
MLNYGLEEGRALVKAARNAIELNIMNPHFQKNIVEDSISHIKGKHGVFVTIEHYPTMALRGCIGFPRASQETSKLLVEAALSAAFDDPRFMPLSKNELDQVIIEVSILSDPEELPKSQKKRLGSVVVGRDGLIIEYGFYSGLLLPIVPVEQGWTKEQFLEEVCEKAGLPRSYWKREDVKLYKFETQIFREKEPHGEVEEVLL